MDKNKVNKTQSTSCCRSLYIRTYKSRHTRWCIDAVRLHAVKHELSSLRGGGKCLLLVLCLSDIVTLFFVPNWYLNKFWGASKMFGENWLSKRTQTQKFTKPTNRIQKSISERVTLSDGKFFISCFHGARPRATCACNRSNLSPNLRKLCFVVNPIADLPWK